MTKPKTEVWITGIGLVSSLGEGVDAHVELLSAASTQPVTDAERFTPYPVHPCVPLEFAKQIPKRSDQNQMETWQRLGTYTAGLALEDAGLAKNRELLDRTNLVVAAGIGERDSKVDQKVLETMDENADADVFAKQVLPSALKPTLFLAQLSNLLAGNISIIHNVTGSSRTFMGEEMAGLSAVENAVRRIQAGQGELFLVGGAFNAERADVMLPFELGRMLWGEAWQPVWKRRKDERGGMVLGSAGAFLVLEAREHAEARGAKPYAGVAGVVSDRSKRAPGDGADTMRRLFDELGGVEDVSKTEGPLPVMSGACGVTPVLDEELAFLDTVAKTGRSPATRAYGSLFGHTVEAHFPLGVALAALALKQGSLPVPFDDTGAEAPLEDGPVREVLVTGMGHWRGEGLALVTAVN
ncbi:MAG: beta-ketoacyl-ACP synthase [Alphaproteobacteria bacterium]